jgi:hypothetical protein
MIDSPEARKEFSVFLLGVAEVFQRSVSPQALEIWFRALKHYSIAAIEAAFSRHLLDTAEGRFFPTIAVIVKQIEGGAEDLALVAWTRVEKAVRHVGPYITVVFPDPIIHCVISDMGGWIAFGRFDDKEWPFKKNEFVKRYQAIAATRRLPAATPKSLTGIMQAGNSEQGLTYNVLPRLLASSQEELEIATALLDGELLKVEALLRMLPDKSDPRLALPA